MSRLDEVTAWVRVAKAVVETVRETEPTSETLIHLSLQEHFALSYAQCDDLVSTLVRVGALERDAQHRLSIPRKP